MESSLIVDKNKGGRKVLGQRPTKVIQNKIDKLILYDSKYYFKSFNFKHVENLLNLDFFKLSPNDFLKIFKVLNKNLYYNENLYYSLYISLLDKIVYFSFDQLLSLIECIAPFTIVKHNNSFSSYFSESDEAKESLDNSDSSDISDTCKDSELVPINDTSRDIYQVQNQLLSKVIDVLKNKLKFNSNERNDDSLETNSRCLNTLNKFSFLNRWDVLLALSNNISRNLINKIIKLNSNLDVDLEINSDLNLDSELDLDSDLDKLLDCVNCVSDTLCLKVIDLVCKNIEINKYKIESRNVVDFVNLLLFEYRDILLSNYSKGDIHVINIIVNYHNKIKIKIFETLSSELVSELHLLCNISNNLYQIYGFLKNKNFENNDNMNNYNSIINNNNTNSRNIDSFLKFNFKILNSFKFMKLIDSTIFNNRFGIGSVYKEMCRNIPEFFIKHKNQLNPKSHSLLLSIISDSLNKKNNKHTEIQEENNFSDSKGLLRMIHDRVCNSMDLSSIDRLNVLEYSYKNYGYINHYSTKRMLDYTLSQFPKNPVDALISLRFLFFSFKLPFNIISTESRNIRKSLDFLNKYIPNSLLTDFKKVEFRMNININRPYLKSTKYKHICQYDNIPINKWKYNRVNNYSTFINLNRNMLRFLDKLKSIRV